jgi:peptidoglycan biosynthesis protein MviN/MurJ (putative lipid II flippase)
MVNLALLLYVLRKRLGVIRWRIIFSSCLKTMAASGMMALFVFLSYRLLVAHAMASAGLHLLAVIGGSVGVFCMSAWLLKIPEWQKMTGLIKRSLNRS